MAEEALVGRDAERRQLVPGYEREDGLAASTDSEEAPARGRVPHVRTVALGICVASCLVLWIAGGFNAGVATPAAVSPDGIAEHIVAKFGDMGPMIHPMVQSFSKDATKADYSSACHINKTEDCPLSEMPKNNITAVFPGGATRCIYGSGPPFFFQVIPGDKDKLVIHFADGGSCWDEATANAGACKTKVAEVSRAGIFNTSDGSDPYGGFSFMVIGYCSGDVHVGAVNRTWNVPMAGNVTQTGYANARAAVDWAKANFPDKLKSLIISGSSAGSLGAQVWSRTVLSELTYESAAVIADSFAGVFPGGTQGAQFKESGLCNTDLIDASLMPLCQAAGLDVQTVYEDTMRRFPEVAFASIDSKVDAVQVAFFQLIQVTLLKAPDASMVNPEIFSNSLAGIYGRYQLHPNWVGYMVNGQNHLYLPKNIMYSTRPGSTKMKTSGALGAGLSFLGAPLSGSDTELVEWLAQFPVPPGGSAKSACRGMNGAPTVPPPTPPPTTSFGLFFHHALNTVKTGVSTLGTYTRTGAARLGLGHCPPGLDGKVFARPPA